MDGSIGAPSPDVTKELLTRPWVLSQRNLLTEKKFLADLKLRGLFVTESHLEILHKHGVLIPWIRVDRDVDEIRREFRRKNPSPWRWELLSSDPPTTAVELVEEWDSGRASDGASRSFVPWKRRLHQRGEISFRAWDYLYSPYQVLLMPWIMETLDLLRRKRQPAWEEGRLDSIRAAAIRQRTFIPLLAELEFVYYAAVRRRYTIRADYGSEEDFQQAQTSFDRVDALSRSGWTPEILLKQAEDWLWTAHARDPLRNWTSLVGLVDPQKWERLEGEALLAIDHRVAAEMVLRFLEDLAREGAAPPIPDHSSSGWYHPLGDRIGRGRSRLERVLTDFGISPHPAVVLILEGPTERYVIREMLEFFGIPILDSFIRLQLLGGVDKQIELLARYLAPALGKTTESHAEMDRPPTRLMIVVDAENRYRTEAGRDSAKEQLVKHLYNALEPEHQTPTTFTDLASLVEIETWGHGTNVEFAHFTDYQIARAILATGKAGVAIGSQALTQQIAGLRSGGGSLKSIWANWPEPRPDKVDVWHHLWPVLRTRIGRAQKRQTEERIPLVRVVYKAYRLATRPRSHTVIRVGPESAD
jgi:hypothetical protein